MKEMPILKDRQKKSKIEIICLILLFNIIMITNVGCTNKKEPIERMPADRRIMQLVYDPGGALTNEEFEERHQTYNVYGDGTIKNKNDEVKKLSDEDLDKFYEYYNDFCNDKVKMESMQEVSLPSYFVLVFDKDKAGHSFSSGAGYVKIRQLEEVEQLLHKYYE